MSEQDDLSASEQIIGKILNKDNPEQVVAIRYLRRESAFVTSGIRTHLGVKEILIPVHLVALDFHLVGAILSAILEKISHSHEMDLSFHYISRFQVLGKEYSLTEFGEYMKIEAV